MTVSSWGAVRISGLCNWTSFWKSLAGAQISARCDAAVTGATALDAFSASSTTSMYTVGERVMRARTDERTGGFLGGLFPHTFGYAIGGYG
jgi:hypothetical protein